MRDGGDAELGAVPGHLRVVPGDDGEVASVRGEPGVGEEVAVGEKDPDVLGAVEGDSDDGPGDGGVVVQLADAPDLVADVQGVGVPGAAGFLRFGGERLRGLAWDEPPQTLVGEVGEDEGLVDDDPGLAAVLVHTRPCVPRRRQDVLDDAVGPPPHDDVAPLLGRSSLGPPDLVADDLG